MSHESRLYKFSDSTKEQLRKFRLGTSRAKQPQAVIYMVDKKSLEIRQDEEGTVYESLQEIADDLPENAPRYVLLSYPLTLASGRAIAPYVMLYYMPVNSNSELRMLYAGAKELMKNMAEVQKILDVCDEDEVLKVEEILKG